MTVKGCLRNTLLAFVFVSIGFGLGKETALRHVLEEPAAASPAVEKVMVYYLRSSFRCMDCNQIENLTDTLIRTEFTEELESGRLEWQTVDYLRNPSLASRYNVSGNMIVAARFDAGKEMFSIRLDRVMELVGDRDTFMGYVRAGISKALKGDAP